MKVTGKKQASALETVTIEGPDGIDLRTSPSKLAPGKARILTNWSLEEPGVFLTRPGYNRFSTSILSTKHILGVQRVYLNTTTPSTSSTNFTIVGYDGTLVLALDNGQWSSAVASGLSTVNNYSFPYDRDMVAVLDGATAPRKSTNGSSWTRMGIANGSTLTVDSTTSGSLLASEFEVSFTYKDRDLAYESNGVSTPSTITLGSTGAIRAVIPNSTDLQVDAFVVYARNKTSGETVLRKVSSAAQSGGTSSTLVITSSGWTTADPIPTTHTVPPILSFGVVWKNRWWARNATRADRLQFTEIYLPQAWPGLFYLDIPFERGDGITAIYALGDVLVIFGQTKVFILSALSDSEFEVRPAFGVVDGAVGFRAIGSIESGLVHAAATGVYLFSGASDQLLTYDLEPGWRDYISHATSNEIAKTPVVYHQARKEVRIAVTRRYPDVNPGEWVLDLNRARQVGQPTWTSTDRDIGGYVLWDGPEPTVGDRGRLFTFSSTGVVLYEEGVGSSANSSNMIADYEGPGLTLPNGHRGRWIDWHGEFEPNVGGFSVEGVVDGVSQGGRGLNIGGAGFAVYGTATYGSGTYAGGGRRQTYTMLPLRAEGRSYVQKMTYTGQGRFRIFRYEVRAVPEPAMRNFVE